MKNIIMVETREILFVFLVSLVIVTFVACGPTYVVPNNGQQAVYDPGYDPNQFLYDAMLADVIVNGIHGYYGPGHVFYPMVTVGGVGGYYDSYHHFHTSVQNKTVVINNYNTGREQFVRQQVQRGKPNYSPQQGNIQRGSPATTTQTTTAKPNYTSGNGGSIQRGAAPSTPAPSAKPNYGSSGGMTRSAPASSRPSSRPSYSSSSGGMSRRK